MNLKKVILLLMAVFAINTIYAQAPMQKANITGTVLDSKTLEVLPYVSAAVLRPTKDSAIVDGGITNDKGVFVIKNVKQGKYILKLSFVGYKDFFKDIEIKGKNINVGTLKLEVSAENLQTVTIVGAKQMMEYKLDKRVINVDQNLVSQGGNASDVLEDVPSVEVDDEGNISLRGGSNVTLLIDGKPSSLYGNDVPTVLAQIPASQIDKIEVITNPSAKYNPEGMSGIINITLKEKGNRGLNGSVNVSSGSSLEKWLPQERVGLNLNYSTKKFSINGGGDFGYDQRERRNKSIRWFRPKNETIPDFVYTKRTGGEEGYNMGISLNGEYYINELNTIGANFNMHYHNSTADWAQTDNRNLTNPQSIRSNSDYTDGDNDGSFNNIGLTYEKKFKRDKEQLFYFSGTWSWGKFSHYESEDVDYYNDMLQDYMRFDSSKSNHHHATIDMHYIHPFDSNNRVEIGYNLNYSYEKSKSLYYEENIFDTNTSYDFKREEQIHAFYATYGLQLGQKLSAQLGLRAEIVRNDFRRDMYTGIVDDFDKNYNSLYPTIHLSYQLNRNHSFQASYSRRIRRPGPWTMMPHVDLTNTEYIRFGNPNIDPEYTNAFELGWSWMFEKTTIFSSAYYRRINNGMQRFEFLWNEENAHYYGFDWAWEIASDQANSSRTAQTFVNLSKSYNYGFEVIIDREWTSWWRMNLSMNAYGANQDGTDLNYGKINTFNFNSKLNTTITLPYDITVQVSGRYYAPRKTIQGRSYAHYDMDLAVRKSLWNRTANIALNFRDVFGTRSHNGYSYTEDYISYNYRRPYSQSIRLSFSYNFGKTVNMRKLKQQKVQNNSSDSHGEEED